MWSNESITLYILKRRNRIRIKSIIQDYISNAYKNDTNLYLKGKLEYGYIKRKIKNQKHLQLQISPIKWS